MKRIFLAIALLAASTAAVACYSYRNGNCYTTCINQGGQCFCSTVCY